MRCPKCGCLDDKVIDSRVVRDGAAVRRRRECLSCSCRYTTIEGIVPEDVVFAGCKFPDKNLAGILEEARRVNAECLVFFSSVHARRFLLCCKENGVREIPLVVNSYTFPYDYFEHPRVIGALVSPFREHVAGEMRRMIEMIENPEDLRQETVPAQFMDRAGVRAYYERQKADPYYSVIVQERADNVSQEDLDR